MILRDYQKEVVNKVMQHLETNQRCCVSLATGGGKTVIFSELVTLLNGKTLVCVHREELVHQTSATLKEEHDLLISKSPTPSKDICVAMVETLNNRINKDVDLNSFDNIIIDEAHRGEFMKILDLFKGKVIGLTATPNYEKNTIFHKCLKCGKEQDKVGKCCNRKLKKYKENVPLADYYHTLIEGIGINELIEKGFLVQDDPFVLPVDTTQLVFNPSNGEYTEESIGLVFGSPDAIENTVQTYRQLAANKKTMIFNPNTLVNKKLYDAMIAEGLENVKMYDSKNTEENRKDLIKWFKDTDGAVLLNVQVFTTGFDCTDVEVILLNKKTKSINLFLQMVGRGGRITDKIFKPKFKVIDMGNNTEDFGNWSDPREWSDMFYDKEKKEVGAPQPAAVRTCQNCQSIIAANSLKCEVCGVERVYNYGGVTGTPIRQGKLKIAEPYKIVEYCEKKNMDILQAKHMVYKLVSELLENVSFEVFKKNYIDTGELFERTRKKIHPYHTAIHNSKLKGNRRRTINDFANQTIKAIYKTYQND